MSLISRTLPSTFSIRRNSTASSVPLRPCRLRGSRQAPAAPESAPRLPPRAAESAAASRAVAQVRHSPAAASSVVVPTNARPSGCLCRSRQRSTNWVTWINAGVASCAASSTRTALTLRRCSSSAQSCRRYVAPRRRARSLTIPADCSRSAAPRESHRAPYTTRWCPSAWRQRRYRPGDGVPRPSRPRARLEQARFADPPWGRQSTRARARRAPRRGARGPPGCQHGAERERVSGHAVRLRCSSVFRPRAAAQVRRVRDDLPAPSAALPRRLQAPYALSVPRALRLHRAPADLFGRLVPVSVSVFVLAFALAAGRQRRRWPSSSLLLLLRLRLGVPALSSSAASRARLAHADFDLWTRCARPRLLLSCASLIPAGDVEITLALTGRGARHGDGPCVRPTPRAGLGAIRDSVVAPRHTPQWSVVSRTHERQGNSMTCGERSRVASITTYTLPAVLGFAAAAS